MSLNFYFTNQGKSMHKLKLLFSYLFFLLLFNFDLSAQSVATIKGKFTSQDWKYNEKSKLILKDIDNQNTIQTINIEKDGKFIIHDIAFASYLLEYYEDNILIASQIVNANSSLTQNIEFTTLKTFKLEDIVVVSDYNIIGSNGARTFYNSQDIENMPSISSSKSIESVILNSPGTVPDEDGRMHVRGEDAQLQYVVDGIPIFSNQTRIYSSLFNSGIIKSMDFIRGGMNAEYGIANSGVLNINSKSGFDRTNDKSIAAHVFSQLGNYNSNDQGIDVSGNIDNKVALFAAYSSNFTGRYLDPINEGDAIHSNGKGQSAFVKADAILSDDIDMVILASYSTSNFDIPNSSILSKQNQKQEMKNSMLGFRINAELSQNSLLSLLAYSRSDMASISSNGIDRITNANDSIVALQNEKFFMGGKRDNKVFGSTLEYSGRLFEKDNFKAGIGGEVFPLKEYLTFAVTNNALSSKDSSGGDERYIPYDITRPGSKPFLIDQSKDGNRYFVYAQDMFTYNDWNFAAGLRYDYYNLFVAENNLSIRLGANYKYSKDLIFRASYNRIVMQAPIENILVSSSNEANMLTGNDKLGVNSRVKSEKSHVLEIGASYRMNKYLTFDLAGYGKLIEDFIVKVELANSGVIFPVNLKNGFVAGGELQIRLNNWNNFSGFLNFSTCASLGLIPEDGSNPISAGLILGEEGHNYSNPFRVEEMFPTEHNQLITSTFNISYKISDGLTAIVGGRFDSGLPFDLVDSNGKGLDETQSRAELKRRGYSDKVIDMLSLEPEMEGSPDKSVAPHATFDLALSADMRKFSSIPVKLTFSIINIFDTEYLYKFESSFGGTHFGTPRMMNLRADVYTFSE